VPGPQVDGKEKTQQYQEKCGTAGANEKTETGVCRLKNRYTVRLQRCGTKRAGKRIEQQPDEGGKEIAIKSGNRGMHTGQSDQDRRGADAADAHDKKNVPSAHDKSPMNGLS